MFRIVPLVLLSAAALAGEYRFQRDYVLGTSLDLVVIADNESAANRAERAVLDEVNRLARILSTYDDDSELSRLNRSAEWRRVSPELLDVITACERWREKSGGAFNAQVAPILAEWKAAEKPGRAPEGARLAELARQICGSAWEIRDGQVRRLGRGAVTVDALAKGYIVDKALAAGASVTGVRGIMLDIGGDIAMSGTAPAHRWHIAVAEPHHPAENAPPLAVLALNAGAVATSGNYARYYQVGQQRHSHIVDPRTGIPADHALSATVVAADCCTADALATILCVLPPSEGLQLVRSLASEGISAQCFIVARDGKTYASDAWEKLLLPRPILAADSAAWPNELTITLTIGNPGRVKRNRRPYVAVWIEDAAGKPVRTLRVFGRERSYLKDLPNWWSFAKADSALIQTVTRASRGPGEYELVWDGTDDRGKLLPPGTYTVRVESNREKGMHTSLKGQINCADAPATGQIAGNQEITAVKMRYGPPESKP